MSSYVCKVYVAMDLQQHLLAERLAERPVLVRDRRPLDDLEQLVCLLQELARLPVVQAVALLLEFLLEAKDPKICESRNPRSESPWLEMGGGEQGASLHMAAAGTPVTLAPRTPTNTNVGRSPLGGPSACCTQAAR